MDGDACGLVYHGEVFIFIENFERNGFWGYGGAFDLRDFDFYLLAGFDAMGGLGEHAIYADASFGD